MLKASDFYIILSVLISFFVSAWLWFSGNQLEGIFTAIWVPAILCFAIYFKLTGFINLYKRNNSND